MKNNVIIFGVTVVMVVLAIVASSFYISNTIVEKDKQQGKLVHKLIDIDGMTCEECEITIGEVGMKIKGVTKIFASSTHKQAFVEFNTSKTDLDTLMKAIRETGYRPLGAKDVNASFKFEKLKEASTMKCGAGKCGANMKQ